MTKIEWTHREGAKGETWNPIRARNRETGGIGHFCVKVSAGSPGKKASLWGEPRPGLKTFYSARIFGDDWI